MKKTYSLRKRLLYWIGFPVLGASALMLFLSYFYIWHEVEEVYDAQLVQSARVLLQLTRHELQEGEELHLDEEDPGLSHKYESKLGFRIWYQGKVVEGSASSQTFGLFQAPPGFSDREVNGQRWRFFVYVDPDNEVRIEVSEQYEVRYELILQLLSSQLIPIVAFIPVLFFLVWLGVNRMLRPVVGISKDVARRSSEDLRPLKVQEVPNEIEPLIKALNELFNQISESFQREREFTDHAAHELRTPLAAMKTQTQVLLRKLQGNSDNVEDLKNLQQSIDRATHLVDQLLALARLQSENYPKEKVDLSKCIVSAVEELALRYQQKDQALKLQIPDHFLVMANAASIEILVRNLLDNAFKYTPDKGAIEIRLSSTGEFQVSDTGPGMSDVEKMSAFDRFYRADKSGQMGSGLGLSIVRWIAEAHNLALTLSDNPQGGLSVSLKFPAN
ncbi:ATP-binding protein [Sneathiella limimaris]|uniref:ATP-binding protein n=1 Tax=Sneathiella limimaris TaxID=1964213 RepID=UPI00146E7D4D|nr:ATP-binding protein [Sneathiella limimaris]